MHKTHLTDDLKQRFDIEQNRLKEASQVAKDIIFPRQSNFEYRDKSNKHLVHILAEVREKKSVPVMYTPEEKELFSMEDKVDNVQNFFC